jgi:hypothetical protein
VPLADTPEYLVTTEGMPIGGEVEVAIRTAVAFQSAAEKNRAIGYSIAGGHLRDSITLAGR